MKDFLDFRVKQANKFFYNTVANIYEDIDGRRTDEIKIWLSQVLKDLSRITDGDVLVDFGCGSGFVSESGKQYFKRIYGIDISFEMLKLAKDKATGVVCADSAYIPLKDNSVDVVVCFAVLHHIFNHKPLFREIYRILRKGGVLYSDHDMNSAFHERYKIPLKLYRYIFDTGKKYIKAGKQITKELYELSEIYSNGLDVNTIRNYLMEEGFRNVELSYHWFGLNRFINRLVKHREFSEGFAPLVRIKAYK
jgi:ubiquinone/menaquinone biosynthesis C-methylase UbiE